MIQAQQIILNHDDDQQWLNSHTMASETTWFQKVLEQRIHHYFELDQAFNLGTITPPDIASDNSAYSQFISKNNFGIAERLTILMALIPHIKPELLDTFFIKNANLDRNYTEFGGWKGKSHSGFLPTVETLVFVLSGNNIYSRFQVLQLFDDEGDLIKNKVLKVDNEHKDEPFLSGALRITTEYLNLFTTGIVHKPDFSMSFPAKRIYSQLDWEELILCPTVHDEVEQITSWIDVKDTIMHTWGLAKNIKPGYRALLYGPPGTGKSLTAALIGKKTNMDVYRVDLSAIVSKYIGETEKNLANIFDQAENKNWILFFDEADALFGKRSNTSSSNDRHSNQEIAYLLQRTEDFPGIIILATNLKANMDEAFVRRFQSIIYFPMPDVEQREQLWKNILGSECKLAKDINIKDLAEKYEMSGGAIINAIRYAAIYALRMGREVINQQDLTQGVVRELRKEGKIIS
jgi:hypothetical protein